MNAFDELNHEHKHIIRMLKIVDHTAEHISSNRPVPVEIVTDELSFIKGFADECHHGKEEGVLFVMVEPHLNADQKETMNRLLKDHVEGRNYVKNARESLNKAAEGDIEAAQEIAGNLKNYTALLRDHIKRESVFFNDIKPLFSEEEKLELDDKCEKIEEKLGEHEHFLEMLDRLEASEILRK